MWLCYGRMIASPVLELGSGQLLVQLRRAPASSWRAPEELLVQLRRSSWCSSGGAPGAAPEELTESWVYDKTGTRLGRGCDASAATWDKAG